jgi:hypothetical protein
MPVNSDTWLSVKYSGFIVILTVEISDKYLDYYLLASILGDKAQLMPKLNTKSIIAYIVGSSSLMSFLIVDRSKKQACLSELLWRYIVIRNVISSIDKIRAIF